MDQSALYEILACSATASFHLAVGAALSFSAILIPQLESPESDIQVTKEDISWIASLITLVMPLGALVAGFLSDRIGRLNTLRLTTVPYSLGWICIARAQDLHMIMLGRVLTGFSLALASNPALVYITEVARPDFRGSLMCLAPSMTSVAMVLVYTQGVYLHWRTIAWISLVYCVLPVVLMFFWSVESPIWLVSKGKTDRALQSFKFLLRKDKEILAQEKVSDLVKEHNCRRMTVNQSRSDFRNLITKFLRPTCWKPMILLTTIFTFQQITGIYITIFYAVSFFKEVGGSVDPFVSTVGIGLVRLVMGITTMFLMRHFGRRPLFIFSGTGMAIFIFVSGYYTREITEGRMERNFVPIVCVLLYMSIGVIGFMSIPWTMTAELFPTDIRGMAQGLMIAIANVITFAVLKVYPFLGDMIGGSYAVQWLFCATSILGTIFIFIFVPETHGKELAEIEEYFQNHTVYILNRNKPTKKVVEEVGEEMVKLKENA